ncbi:U-box domain-containing protein 21-like [Cornus florida]|uniref:U-box domain-containing protein 21-like n=1 Tax=Cornus florida TaxID=4283 RepID=UPI0028987915|nr:U-box domain-containing protein 21-like [Cornus florida]
MIFYWRRRRAVRLAGMNKLSDDANSDVEITVPSHFQCPISLELMKDPVTLSTGITYDRESIEKWIETGHTTCPVTKQVLWSYDQIPNHAIRKIIQEWCVENRSHGVERIPTPRIPITQLEVSEVCSKIMSSTRHGDEKKCEELVGKIEKWAKESEKNKRCVIENGTGFVLSSSFESFASVSIEKHECLLKMILSTLTWMFPLGVEGQSKLGSTTSLRCMAWFLKGEDKSSRQNAVLALEKLLSLDQQHVNALAEIEGVAEALFKIIMVPIRPKATKASLMVIYHLISPSATSENMTIIRRFVEMGLVELILEVVVDAERGICERALGVLECMCVCDEGREVALNHALTTPVLVKKILRVSETATEFSVSVLWKLCRDENGGVVVEAVQLGCFQKLLVVLQVGCGERTKERVTELLKLLNRYKDRFDCVDSSNNLKYLKRSY